MEWKELEQIKQEPKEIKDKIDDTEERLRKLKNLLSLHLKQQKKKGSDKNEWDGVTRDYTRKEKVLVKNIILPDHIPKEFNDSRLCNSWWESRQKWVIILLRLKVLLG